MTPILETSRLILRPLDRLDAGQIQRLFPNWNVVKWLAAAIPWPYPDNGAEEFLDRVLPEVEEGSRYMWAITLKSDPESKLIGIMDLFPNNADDNRGFWIGEEYHGNGYMSEAVAVATDFAFDALGLESLLLNNAEPNIASHRLKEKAGAEIVDIKEDVKFVSGTFRSIQWRLTKEAWQANRASFVS